ncbi:EAL domain-containing protein [Nocardioides caeni]|uniref:EAL domain-containing protein n=1 Tax=Nocardioides caeni TaxID=574700 RepID=A0A4S8N4G0_9ACTN|nr:EAL domain-containing protein [Nocardioides caeni]THV10765.1 EAL domain-containing protein [Nocardioides caeni]
MATTAQAMTAELVERALAQGDVVVHYQPCYDLRTGAMVAVEALARLRHPETGELVEPGRFLDVLEETGRVVHLDEMVLSAAAEQVARWRELPGGAGLCLAVNLSPADLDDPLLPRRFREVAQTAGLPLDAVIVELTETLLSRSGQGHEQVLAELGALGCNVTLDDFGTGNASFDYLRRFHVDGVKIDRSFIQFLGSGGPRERMAESLVRFCLSLGVHVVAEGVERPRHVRALRRLGCPFGQGFLMSRPVDAEALGALLTSAEVPAPLAHPADPTVLPVLGEQAPRRPRRFDRFAARVLAALVIAVLGLTAALASAQRAESQDSLVDAAQSRLEAINVLSAQGVDMRLGGLRDVVTTFSGSDVVRTALVSRDPARMDLALDALSATATGTHNTSLYDARGTMLALSPAQRSPDVVGRNFAFREWFAAARRAEEAYVSQAYRLMTAEGTWAIAVVAPVRDGRGRLQGFVMATLALSALQAEIQSVFEEHGVDVTVVDRHGTTLASTVGLVGAATADSRLLERRRVHGEGDHAPLWAAAEVETVGGWLLTEQDRETALGHTHARADVLMVLVVVTGMFLVLVALVNDARRRRLKADLRRSNEWLASILEATPTGVLVSDDEDRIHDANEAAAELLGVPAESLRGQTISSWLTTRDRPSGASNVFTATIVTRSGDLRRVEVRVRELRGPDGERMRLHSLVDVTPHRQEQDRLRALGRMDALTGAANRIALQEALSAAAAPGRSPHALVMLDLDGFKSVNDGYGHAAGDSVLCAVADVLVDAVQPSDTVARLGGDEFVLVARLDGATTHTELAGRLQTQVQQALDAHPFALHVPVGVSIGSVLIGAEGRDPDELLRLVDLRMYESKRQRSWPRDRPGRRTGSAAG